MCRAILIVRNSVVLTQALSIIRVVSIGSHDGGYRRPATLARMALFILDPRAHYFSCITVAKSIVYDSCPLLKQTCGVDFLSSQYQSILYRSPKTRWLQRIFKQMDKIYLETLKEYQRSTEEFVILDDTYSESREEY